MAKIIVISEEQSAAIVKAYESGFSTGRIGKLYGLGATFVRGHLEAKGVPRRAHSVILTFAQQEEIIGLYQAGWSQGQVSARFCVSRRTCEPIWRKAKEAGIAMQPRQKSRAKPAREPKEDARRKGRRVGRRWKSGPLSIAAESEAVVLYLGGKTINAIATLLNSAYGTVARVLEENGVRRQGRGQGCKPTRQELDEMINAYLAGSTQKEAAAMIGRTHIVCSHELKRRGIVARKACGSMHSIRISAQHQGVSVENWAGFVSKDWRRLLTSADYKKWRNAVLRRDKFKCVDCGAEVKDCGELNVHHIYKRALYPHLALVTENGVTLCENCHYLTYGREESFIGKYLLAINSPCRPLVWFDSWPDRP